jgi:hypothetical protein
VRQLALTVLAGIAIGGCGSTDHIEPAIKHGSNAELRFDARAKVICATAKARALELGRARPGVSSFEFLAHANGLLVVWSERLKAVDPPARVRPAFDSFVLAIEHEAVLTSLLNLDDHLPTYSGRARVVKTKMRANDLTGNARAFGVPDCTAAAIMISRDREAKGALS